MTKTTIQMLRGQVEMEIKDTGAIMPATKGQYELIAGTMEQITGKDRETRIRMLQAIYPYGVRSVESTKHLSVLEASVFIRFMFGLDPHENLPEHPQLTPEAEAFLEDLQHDILWSERQKIIGRGQLELETASETQP